MFTNNQKMKEILLDKSVSKIKDLLFPPTFTWINDNDITPQKLSDSFLGVGDYSKRLNYVKKQVDSNVIFRDKLYTEEQIEKDNSLNKVEVLEYLNKESNKVAIIIPGGGYYNVCSYSEGWPMAQELYERGYNCFVLYYRVFPNAYMPKPIEDVASLVDFIKRTFAYLDINSYLLLGFSAGGHLAGMWASKQGYLKYNLPKPKYLCLTYPVVDLSLNKGVTKINCLGENCKENDITKYSVYTNVDKDYPVTYLSQGKNDQCISFENSVIMDKALSENGVKHYYKVYEDAPHGFSCGVGTQAEGWIDEMLYYFKKEI